MATMQDLLKPKGSQVYSIGPGASVLEAAIQMNDRRVGALVVVDRGRVAGIFTERDVLRRVVAQRLDSAAVRVGEVMTTEVVCCTLGTSIEEARAVFKNRRIRHLPVVDDHQQIAGLISIGDLNAYESTEKETTIRFLREYLYGTQ
jgi:CBS domain-containing protein